MHTVTPPADPRAGWELPPPGTLPAVADLGELTTRVVAPNASHMTLDGTNTYVIGAAGSGVGVVVDPGPDDATHRQRVEEVLARRDMACGLIVVTHHHHDHTEAARAWADHFGCPVAAPSPRNIDEQIRPVHDGDRLTMGGLTLDALATPGHCSDHTVYRLPDGSLLAGDHILGRGTAIVAFPDGDLPAYLASLRRVLDLGPDTLLPGHGPELAEDPAAVVHYYLEHRAFREGQVLAILAAGVERPRKMVERIYADVSEALWSAAECSTRAALAKLITDGRVTSIGDHFALSH
jgi:glyoxylase-like metal-dependent hydrolase (beta-lactamase superfamily II)